MKIPVIIFVAQIFCSVINAELCEDVDSTACARIANLHPNMCNDSCIANVCKRLCGHCPLKCYSCSDISEAETCNTTQVCPSLDHSCTVVKSFTNDFRLVYKLGCAQNSICQTQTDFNCCTSDLCNHHIIGSNDAPYKVLKRATSSVCADIDDVACNLLYKANPHMCSEDCIATSLCPRLCGMCYECYECDHVSRTENCNTTKICESGHVCYTMETLNFNFEHGFKVGCIHNQVCSRLATEASNVFGRRDNTVEVSLNGGCCHGDLCNLHKLLPTTTTMATTTTTKMPTTTSISTCRYHGNCPIEFHEESGKCYHFSSSLKTWTDAKNHCEQLCGTLAVFSNETEFRDFIHNNILGWASLAHTRHMEFYVGGYDPTHTNHWEWITNGHSIPTDMLDSGEKGYCATIRFGHSRLIKQSCTSHLLSVCQADHHH